MKEQGFNPGGMGPLENLSYGRSPVVPLIVSSEERALTERGKKAIAMFIFVVMLTVGAMQQARGLRLGCKSCKSGLRLRRCSIIN